jgi:hypothetical protein
MRANMQVHKTLADNQYLNPVSGIFVESGKKLKVDQQALIEELAAQGFRIDKGGTEPRLLKVTEQGIVRVIEHPAVLGPEIRRSLTRREELAAWTEYASKDPFSRGFINLLQPLEGTFLTDTATNMYIPFTNGVVNISAKSIKLDPYDRDKLIWASHVIPREIKLKGGNKKCMYDAFIKNLAGKDNLLQIKWALGYLLHDLFVPGRARIVVLYDKAESKGNHGRTGKDLLLHSIGHIRRTAFIDARTMQKEDNRFLFGEVTEETQFLHVSDPRYYNILSDMFNRVEGKFKVEDKNVKAKYIKSPPKIAISSNIMFPAENSSEKARQVPIILKPYYRDLGVDEPILDTHGKRFFTEWTADDWNKFYITMFDCGQTYLKEKKMPDFKFDMIYLQTYKQQSGIYAKYVEDRIVKGKKSELVVLDMATQYIDDLDLEDDAEIRKEVSANMAKAIQQYAKATNSSITKRRAMVKGRKLTIYTLTMGKK